MKPIIAITIGDACGVGPEVVFKALARDDVRASCRPIVVGAMPIIKLTRDQFAQTVKLRRITDIAQAEFPDDAVECLDLQNLVPSQAPRGQLSPLAGKAAAEFAINAARPARRCFFMRNQRVVVAPLSSNLYVAPSEITWSSEPPLVLLKLR